MKPLFNTELPGLNLIQKGKVRDIYDLGENLLMVASDRLSAFDVILPDPIPDKGKVLTLISLFWFDKMKSLLDNHVITGDVTSYPSECRPYEEVLKNRSMLVRKTNPLPVECVVRGYISGSGWKSYQKTGSVCGISLPEGLKESQKLPRPIFTPSTKAELGDHDINIDFHETRKLLGEEKANKIKDLSLEIYERGTKIADEKGIIIADTKFEFGMLKDKIILIDEVMTPDSSRFWPKDSYIEGCSPKSFDKQYVRDYLLSLEWDKKAPGPRLPVEVVENTRKKYIEALKLITGSTHGL